MMSNFMSALAEAIKELSEEDQNKIFERMVLEEGDYKKLSKLASTLEQHRQEQKEKFESAYKREKDFIDFIKKQAEILRRRTRSKYEHIENDTK